MCCRGYICCLDMLKSEPSSDSESDNFYDRRDSNNPSEPITTARDNSQALRQNLASSDEQFKAATSGTNVKVEVHDNVIRIIGHFDTATATQDLKAKDSETVSRDEAHEYQLNAINPKDKSSCRSLFDNCNANSCLCESDSIRCGELKPIDVSNMAHGVVYDKNQNGVVPKEQAISTQFFDKYEANNYMNGSEVHRYDTIVNDMCSPIKQIRAPKEEYIAPKSDINDNANTTEFSELEIGKSTPKVLYNRDAVVTKSVFEIENCAIYEPVLDEDLHASANQESELNYKKVDNLNIPWIDDPKDFNISLTKSHNAQKITIQSCLDKNNAPPTESTCIDHPFTSGNDTNPFMVNTPKDMVVSFPLKDISSFANKSLINTHQADNNRNESDVVDAQLDLLVYDASTTDDGSAYSKINAMDPININVCDLLIDISQFDNYFNEERISTQHRNAYETSEVGSCGLPTDNFVAKVSRVDNSLTKTSEIAAEINSLNELGSAIDLSVSTTQEDTINYTKTEDINIPWIDETMQIEFIAEQSYTTIEVGICSHSDNNKELNIHCNESLELINPCPDSFSNVVDAEQYTKENVLLKDIPMLLENRCSHEQDTHASLIDMDETVDCLTQNEITKNVENFFNETVGCSILNPTIANKHDITTKLIDVYGIDNNLNESSKYHILNSTESDMIDFSSPVKLINTHKIHKVSCVIPVSETTNNSESAEYCELITDNLVTEATDTCIKKSLIEFTAEEELNLRASTICKDTIKNVQINNLNKLSIGDIEPLNSSALEMYIPQNDAINRQSKKNENLDMIRTESTVVNTQQPVIANYILKDIRIENEIKLVNAKNATAKNLKDRNDIPYIN
ncbi:uncharacterized protein LOC119672248 isoform X2 [Teleopsis dalmanni]|uniref:uncharacterized protein LOC119672248 isoform X2 n=1 Tax=Teleopsis dalmanni TaxID=139649 RepID=UPI0018CD0D9C|nr:uncharacterized protein LOC119672248 isoform X2 [Teleopsis dalmanni]